MLMVIDNELKEISVYDSLMGPAEELQKDINIMIEFINGMGRLVGDQNCSYLFNIKSLNQQENGVDCGIYFIKNFINTIHDKENSLSLQRT